MVKYTVSRYKFFFLAFWLAPSIALTDVETNPYPYIEQESQQLVIHNRLLAKINGNAISVLDVLKKMDYFLNQHYPDVMTSLPDRLQFYTTNWRETFKQMIDSELVLADAEGKDLKISDGDIREQVLARFGPNVMATLDKLKLSYDEARKLVHEEMIVQRMIWFKVQSKALQNVGPQDVRDAYQLYLEHNPPEEQWVYQVVSIRSPQDTAVAEQLAQTAYELLHSTKADLNSLSEQLQSGCPEGIDVTIQVSQELQATEKTISEAHKQGLIHLSSGDYSKPMAQTGRGNQATPIQRIFFLKDRVSKTPPPFEHLANQLKERLLDAAISQEDAIYKTKLRQRFSFSNLQLEELPDNFTPFSVSFRDGRS